MDFDLILELHNKGLTQQQISEQTHYPQSAISIALRAMDFKGRRAEFLRIKNPIVREFCIFNNLTIRGLAKILNCSKDKANSFLEEDREVRFSIAQINRLLNVMNKTYEEVFGGKS